MTDARVRARSFGQVAELYDKRRPSYPSELFDDLIALAGADGAPVARALEAGAGTGRATVELARRGIHVTALEHDAGMAAVARRAAEGLPVAVRVEPFEAWHGEPGSIDLIASAQAWHWIDPSRGLAVARAALRPGGVLALWWNIVDGRDGPVHAAVDAAYAEHAPELLRRSSLTGGALRRLEPEALRVDGFAQAAVREYRWTWRLDAAAYAELIATHSDHILLGAPRLSALRAAVRGAIETAGDGEITVPYRTDLVTARRVDG
jgi:SAM-dependent methyltransferase